MCENCIRLHREEYETTMKAANEHMDAQGVPDESLYRGLASVQVACTIDPMLRILMAEMYPTPTVLMQ